MDARVVEYFVLSEKKLLSYLKFEAMKQSAQLEKSGFFAYFFEQLKSFL